MFSGAKDLDAEANTSSSYQFSLGEDLYLSSKFSKIQKNPLSTIVGSSGTYETGEPQVCLFSATVPVVQAHSWLSQATHKPAPMPPHV